MRGGEIAVVFVGMKAMLDGVTMPLATALGIQFANRPIRAFGFGEQKIAILKCFYFFLQAYFRQGVALQYLGRHADALAAFASGLAQDPKSLQLLVGMVEAAMKSPLRVPTTHAELWREQIMLSSLSNRLWAERICMLDYQTIIQLFSSRILTIRGAIQSSGAETRESLEPTYQQLQKMKLDKSPFVVVSVIGQELLTATHHGASVVVLEAALKIGDQTGECRAHGNLGSAFFSKGNYREALSNHRHQLVLAMKLKDREWGVAGMFSSVNKHQPLKASVRPYLQLRQAQIPSNCNSTTSSSAIFANLLPIWKENKPMIVVDELRE
ncbi:hypothetical protein DNTS_024357 [Danionella cerebrum]|uniref:Tetratricopeptide repeat protein 28 n=1 Tax=Danionella cerebrum TaxID=2873325 RepID=A0A553QVD7_9TELE|nr:hypothetical protein DNTS_024357 [Danionella translucida]